MRFFMSALVCLGAVYQGMYEVAQLNNTGALLCVAAALFFGNDAAKQLHAYEDRNGRCVECGDWVAVSGRWCNQCEAGIRFEYDLEQTR